MRRDQQRLNDILEALDTIARFIRSKSESEFMEDELLRDAVARRLAIVGEAATRISNELRDRHQSVPWPRIIAFRNILVYDYFGVHWPIVWHTAHAQSPELRTQILKILREEFPG